MLSSLYSIALQAVRAHPQLAAVAAQHGTLLWTMQHVLVGHGAGEFPPALYERLTSFVLAVGEAVPEGARWLARLALDGSRLVATPEAARQRRLALLRASERVARAGGESALDALLSLEGVAQLAEALTQLVNHVLSGGEGGKMAAEMALVLGLLARALPDATVDKQGAQAERRRATLLEQLPGTPRTRRRTARRLPPRRRAARDSPAHLPARPPSPPLRAQPSWRRACSSCSRGHRSMRRSLRRPQPTSAASSAPSAS